MKPTIFIHTNHKQMLGALVAQYAFRRDSAHNDAFDVRFIELKDFPALHRRHGQKYLRHGKWALWDNEDLQSFTPLRFLPAELMGYEGRALLVDPDVFAQGDIWDLLSRDMNDKAILCREIPGDGKRDAYFASSVMLLDAARLKHWRWEESIAAMFEGRLDYRPWISLHTEAKESIGPLEEVWNSFDVLRPQTRLLHNTGRITQPWKTGLPIDFVYDAKRVANEQRPGLKTHLAKVRSWVKGQPYAPQGFYKAHPDPNQEAFFFRLLAECLDRKEISEKFVRAEVKRGYVRPDALRLASQCAA